MEKYYIVDAANLLFRSYYAIGFMTNQQGQSTNALFGFIRSILKLIKDFSPTHLIIVFDGPDNKRERRALYEHYKSHRTKMPEDLFPQIEMAVEFCEAYGIPTFNIEGVEADDTMGSLAKWIAEHKGEAYLCSSDKDLCQLVNEHVFVLNLAKDNLVLDKDKVKEVYGVWPNQIVDYLALMGDQSDNIPGLEGIGPKSAIQLIEEFGTLENILDNASNIKGKKGEVIKNGREIALLSRKLAEINTKVPFEKDKELYRLKAPDIEKLKELYQRMHFNSLLKELEHQSPQPAKVAKEEKVFYKTLATRQDIDELKLALFEKGMAAIDTETTSLNQLEAEVVGVSFSHQENHASYIPLVDPNTREELIKVIKEIVENPFMQWIGHNIKYDKHALENEGIHLTSISFDTMLASYLIHPHNPRHNLDALSLDHFGKVKIPIEDLIGKGKNQINMKDVPIEKIAEYGAEDADYTYRLKKLFEKELKENKLEKVFSDIEIPLIPVLYSMERKGVYVDKDYLQRLSKEFSVQIEQLQQEIYTLANEEFNINSPKQLSTILFEKMGISPPKKTATGYSTAADVLESLQNEIPLVKKIIEYRTIEKLRSTFVDALIDQISPKTHRIHCTFNQSVAATGRLSSQDPNLQNIPVRTSEGKKIRNAFKPSKENWSFISADYSQIELRLLAHMSEDPELIKAFNHDQDVHTYTASLVFDVPIKEVTAEMRYRAKAVNFGILYGQQAFGLSQGLSIGYHEAGELIKKYFDRYKRVKEYIEESKAFVRKHGYSLTLTGRKRPIPEINSTNGAIRAAAERLAVNTPLQGTQADLIKIAMVKIYKELEAKKALDGHMLIQIHDELIFESPDEHKQQIADIAKRYMEKVIELKVPLIVNISFGKNWGEC